MDGVKIHLYPNIMNHMRSVGLYVLFLPAYCPFFNPIEITFSSVKQHLQQTFRENSGEERMALNEVLWPYESASFLVCVYEASGLFNPFVAYDHDTVQRNCETQELQVMIYNDENEDE